MAAPTSVRSAFSIKYRSGPVQLSHNTELLVRFWSEKATVEQIANLSLNDYPLYEDLMQDQGLGLKGAAVLSVFAPALIDKTASQIKPPGIAANNTRSVTYGDLKKNGVEVWPTNIFFEGEPEANNEIHFDVVVLKGPSFNPKIWSTSSPAARRSLRGAHLKKFEDVLSLFS